MILAGIDEAGRGPVIGPMVIAICAINEKNNQKLAELGVKDSKLLTPGRRERLFSEIQKNTRNKILIISAEEIDEALSSEELNLNWLEAIKSVELIDSIKPDKVILDSPSPNIEAYVEYVKKRLKSKTEVIAEHKADLNNPTVAAASILAKVTRDREILKIKEKYGIDFGSGYPSDPFTEKFLKENYDKYPIFRKSWASYKRLVDSKKQKRLGEF